MEVVAGLRSSRSATNMESYVTETNIEPSHRRPTLPRGGLTAVMPLLVILPSFTRPSHGTALGVYSFSLVCFRSECFELIQ